MTALSAPGNQCITNETCLKTRQLFDRDWSGMGKVRGVTGWRNVEMKQKQRWQPKSKRRGAHRRTAEGDNSGERSKEEKGVRDLELQCERTGEKVKAINRYSWRDGEGVRREWNGSKKEKGKEEGAGR